MTNVTSDSLPLDPSPLREIDQICDQFEAAWRSGAQPKLEDWIQNTGESLRHLVFPELLLIDLEYTSDQGDSISRETYEHRFPEFAELIGKSFEQFDNTQTASETLNLNQTRIDGLPDRFGEYELLEEVGRGGMGIVFRAVQKSLDRVVALKVMRWEGRQNPEAIRRFQNEARATARLQHPGIVQVFDVGVVGNIRYFTMEFVEGSTLSEKCAASHPTKTVLQYMCSLTSAVHHAHEQGVLHRDLKPSNILVDRTGRLRIVDFGLAKYLNETGTLTSIGQIVGTPSYMSPEQARGHPELIDRRTDVYSLGAVMYSLLTGTPPFLGQSSIDTLVQVIHDSPIPPHRRNAKVSRRLESICLKCLSKTPEARYATAKDLELELEALLNSVDSADADDTRDSKSSITHLLNIPVVALRSYWFRSKQGVITTLGFIVAASVCLFFTINSLSTRRDSLDSKVDIHSTLRKSAQTLNLQSPVRSRNKSLPIIGPGIPVANFGTNGVVRHEFGSGGIQDAYAIAEQSDGKIVVAGQVSRKRNTYYVAVARFNQDGSLDTTFNTTGKLILWFGIFDDGVTGRTLAIQPDGKIVVGGRAEVSSVRYDVGLARINPDGTMDSNFGQDGIVTTVAAQKGSAYAEVLRLQSDGKIVVVGNSATHGDNIELFATRYLPNGSLDADFGKNGLAHFDFPGNIEQSTDAQIQDDGKIVIIGRTEGAGQTDLVVLRLDSRGQLDPSFASSGKLIFDIDQASNAPNVVAFQGRKLLIQMEVDSVHHLVRFDENGQLDTSFGDQHNGRVRLPESCTGFVLVSGLRILVPSKIGNRLYVYSPEGQLEKRFALLNSEPLDKPLPRRELREFIQARNGDLLFCGYEYTSDTTLQWYITRWFGLKSGESNIESGSEL